MSGLAELGEVAKENEYVIHTPKHAEAKRAADAKAAAAASKHEPGSEAAMRAYHRKRGTSGDHRLASAGMSNEDWQKHMVASNQGAGMTQAQAPADALDRIRSNRAHEASGATAPGPHAANEVKATHAARQTGGFKLPKGSKRVAGGVVGLGALTAGAKALSDKRRRDASG